MRWNLKLTCNTCRANIIFEDERPKWRVDNEPILAVNGAARARVDGAEPVTAPCAATATGHRRRPTVQALAKVDETPPGRTEGRRYVACPACDGRVYLGEKETGYG
jgi:hypothetical protein